MITLVLCCNTPLIYGGIKCFCSQQVRGEVLLSVQFDYSIQRFAKDWGGVRVVGVVGLQIYISYLLPAFGKKPTFAVMASIDL